MGDPADWDTKTYRARAAAAMEDYRPVQPPVTLYRRFQRDVPSEGPVAAAGAAEIAEAVAEWMDTLGRELANHSRPLRSAFDVRCQKRHPLLWLVPSPSGLVPVSRLSEEQAPDSIVGSSTWTPWPGAPSVVRKPGGPKTLRYDQRFQLETTDEHQPRTLGEWELERPMPLASCACHGEVRLTLAQINKARRTARRSATYRPDGSIV